MFSPKRLDILRESMKERQGMMSGHHVIACNKIYQKILFANIRYPVGQVHEDEETAHRLIGACQKVVGVAEQLYYYRQHPNSITKEKEGQYRNLCIALAYGDRILFCTENQIQIAEDLFKKYWTTLIGCFDRLYKEKRCVGLIGRTKKQMREVVRYYVKTNDTIIRKIGVCLLCAAPKGVSSAFRMSVKLRGG